MNYFVAALLFLSTRFLPLRAQDFRTLSQSLAWQGVDWAPFTWNLDASFSRTRRSYITYSSTTLEVPSLNNGDARDFTKIGFYPALQDSEDLDLIQSVVSIYNNKSSTQQP